MTISPDRVDVCVFAATSKVTRCSPCPDIGATFVTQLTPFVIRHEHSGSVDTMNEPLPPLAATGCRDADVVTAQDTTEGLDDPMNDESQATASVSTMAPKAPVRARAGTPGSTLGPRRFMAARDPEEPRDLAN
jgi:hypothetical protein